jgi:hypothetical protein
MLHVGRQLDKCLKHISKNSPVIAGFDLQITKNEDSCLQFQKTGGNFRANERRVELVRAMSNVAENERR